MLPSQGICVAIFLLGRSGVLTARRTIEEWIDGARSTSSFMAASLSFEAPVEVMFQCGLAKLRDGVEISPELTQFVEVADRRSLFAIARIVMLSKPPLWLHLAVDREVRREYVPLWDLEELSWLDPDLDALLLEVAAAQNRGDRDDIRKQLGDAAELAVFDSLNRKGLKPLHVSRISDAFGYDIECRSIRIDRIEVKASSETTRGRFLLSRNEYEKSLQYGSQWRLIQLVFLNKAFVNKQFDSLNVAGAFQLREGTLQQVVPVDTEWFRWVDSAELTVPSTYWLPVKL